MQKWNTVGYPAADITMFGDDAFAAIIQGIDTVATRYSGATDPSTSAPVAWGLAEVGKQWLDTGVTGTAANPVLKEWQQIAVSGPTYGWRIIRRWKSKFLTTPQAVTFIPASAAAADVAYTDVSLASLLNTAGVQDASQNECLVRAVWMRIRVRTGASETIPSGDNCYFAVREKGSTTEFKVYPQVAARYVEAQVLVGLNSSEIFQFAVDVGGGTPAFEYEAWMVGFVEEL